MKPYNYCYACFLNQSILLFLPFYTMPRTNKGSHALVGDESDAANQTTGRRYVFWLIHKEGRVVVFSITIFSLLGA